MMLAAGGAAADAWNYPALVRRIYDLERLAQPVAPGERAGLASSYDRASRYDAAGDRYVEWAANNDGTGIVREEGGQEVLAEIAGPGCIWRIWAATVTDAHVRIYLDGAKEPAVDLPWSGYFDRQHEPFTRPNLVYITTAQGHNNLTPIPFQRSCRIVADKGWGKYYQFTYTRFPAGTGLPTFSRQLAAGDSVALDVVDRLLGSTGNDPAGDRPGAKTLRARLVAAPRSVTPVVALEGAGAITSLRVRVALPPGPAAQRRVLRELVLSIKWDGAAEPAVWSPLGDFFGSAAGAVPFRTLPVGHLEQGQWYCHWYMPFSQGAEIMVQNDGATAVPLEWEVVHAPLREPAGQLLRFHAKWHGDLPAVRADRLPDWRLLETTGAGRYVGTQLHVWNPRGGWWGEGDEKFFIDGEKFPSVFGTGTEDYFGYAWSSGKTFVQALHSQPVNENNRGHVSVNRWHIADDIPFTRSFEGTLEKYFPNANPTLFRAVVYWYLAPEGADPYGAIPLGERIVDEVHPPIHRAAGVLEAEEMLLLKVEPAAHAQPQDAVSAQVPPGLCSNDRFVMWWAQAAGQRLELSLPAVEPGRYRVLIRYLGDETCGRFQFFVGEQPLGDVIDTYADRPAMKMLLADPTVLGEVELGSNDAVLAVEARDPRAEAKGRYLALDYVQLVRVPAGKWPSEWEPKSK